MTMGLMGSPPGVTTTAKIDDRDQDVAAHGAQPLDVQDAQLGQHHQHDRELHDQPEDQEHGGHEAEVRLGARQ